MCRNKVTQKRQDTEGNETFEFPRWPLSCSALLRGRGFTVSADHHQGATCLHRHAAMSTAMARLVHGVSVFSVDCQVVLHLFTADTVCQQVIKFTINDPASIQKHNTGTKMEKNKQTKKKRKKENTHCCYFKHDTEKLLLICQMLQKCNFVYTISYFIIIVIITPPHTPFSSVVITGGKHQNLLLRYITTRGRLVFSFSQSAWVCAVESLNGTQQFLMIPSHYNTYCSRFLYHPTLTVATTSGPLKSLSSCSIRKRSIISANIMTIRAQNYRRGFLC